MALKDLKSGTAIKLAKLTNEEHKTTPPGRYSEVKLVAELENRNIGRPSTFSSIVSLIQDRGYVAKKGTQLYPTPLGFAVARLLAAKFPTFAAYDYTAQMENELDEIAAGKQQRVKFLDGFWHGKDGFEKLLEILSASIDFKELEQYSMIDLYNGYSVKFSKFGTFLQDNNGKPNDKGYLPAVRIDDDSDVFEFKDVEICKKAFEDSANKVETRELGVLESGEYKGWTLWAKDGRFGAYLQAIHPDYQKVLDAGKKPTASIPQPINHLIPEGSTVESVELEQVASMFEEIKLPRWSSDKKWLVGIGKRGAYIGRKASVKGRPVFRGLPDTEDPRTISFDKVQELWAEAEKAAAEKKAVPKKTAAKPAAKPAAKKAAPKKAAPRKTPPKK